MNQIQIAARARRSWLVAITMGMLLLGMSTVASAEQGKAMSSNESGSITDQLEADITPIPVGMGALLVPSLTDAGLEPGVQVFYGKDRIAWGRTGERLIVPPGTYKVVVGHGDLENRPSTQVTVGEGATTPVAPFYAAVRVTAVTPTGEPVEVDYVIEDQAGGVIIGSGETTESYKYHDTRTWLLGADAITIALDGGRSSRSAIEVKPAPGQVLRYRLVVLDGKILRAELADRELVKEEKWWRLRWVLGGEASFARQDGRLGSVDGDFLRAGLFTQVEAGVDWGNNLALLRLDIDESWISLNQPGEDLELQKFSDEVQAEILYTYRAGRVIGPYARGVARTSLTETLYRAKEDTRVIERDIDGEQVNAGAGILRAGEDLQLLKGFQPMDLRAGAGLSLTAFDNQTANLTFFGGAAVRRATYDNGLLILDHGADSIDVIVLQDDESVGAEAGMRAGLRLGENISWSISGDMYIPADDISADVLDEGNPVYRLDNTVTFNVNSFLSVVYDLDVRKEAYEYSEARLSHNLSLRLQHVLF